MERAGAAGLALLRCSARVAPDAEELGALGAIAARVQRWDEVVAAAEEHGIAPLLHVHLRAASIQVPEYAARQLLALVVRHRHATRVRTRALSEILAALDGAGIAVIVLKGAALQQVLYAAPEMRPMNDLDLLVDARQAAAAQAVLRRLGFNAPATVPDVRLLEHHHLPAATRESEGVAVQVEIHHDALSRDWRDSLTLQTLSVPPRAFTFDGRDAHALGHVDMLRHIAHHCADRGPGFRLIWVADLVGYAQRYHAEIDWEKLRIDHPFVSNALSLMHFVTPLPPLLTDLQPTMDRAAPTGVGQSCKSLEMILQGGRTVSDVLRDLLYPSDWWLRLYYGVDPRLSLLWCRWVQHPAHVVRGGIERAQIYASWRTGLTR